MVASRPGECAVESRSAHLLAVISISLAPVREA
jgi:hypothetical protein